MLCRQQHSHQVSYGWAPLTPWPISESYQKPPLPSPRRPPAPPSPYNRCSQATQPSNPFRGRPTLGHSNSACRPSPHHSAPGFLTGTSGELDQMGIAGVPMHSGTHHPESYSVQQMNRTNSSHSYESSMHRAEHPKPYPIYLAEPMVISMQGQIQDSQLDDILPGDNRQQAEPRLGTARSSRSNRTRPGGSRAGSRVSSAIGSAASAWVQSHSAHQLAADVKALAAEVTSGAAVMTFTYHTCIANWSAAIFAYNNEQACLLIRASLRVIGLISGLMDYQLMDCV